MAGVLFTPHLLRCCHMRSEVIPYNQTAVLCGMPTIQYLAGRGLLSVHKLFTSCIRWCLVSRSCDWVMSALSAVLLIFSLQFSLLFFHIGRQTWFTQYWTSDVPKIWGVRFLYTAYIPEEWFWIIILTVKMEIRHPVEGYFGNEFRTIAELRQPEVVSRWNLLRNFLRFFPKNDPVR